MIQRAHEACPLFNDANDRDEYLRLLLAAAHAWHIKVHAFGLFAREVRIFVSPSDDEGITKLMQAVAGRFALWIRRRSGRAGTPWRGRFSATLVEPNFAWASVMRFVECADDASGAVIASTLSHHLGEKPAHGLIEHPGYWQLGNTPFEREVAYRNLIVKLIDPAAASALRSKLLAGWPLGNSEFLQNLSIRYKRLVFPRARGRPKTVPI